MSRPELLVIYSHSAGQNVRAKELPQQGKTLWAKSWQCNLDGAKGTNVAVAAARLGTATALISCTGDDFWADLADRLLDGSGVDTTFLVRDRNRSTPTGIVFVDDEGNNAIVLSPDTQSVPFAQIDEALARFAQAGYVASGYELDEASANYALRKAKEAGIKTALNTSPVPQQRPDLSFVTLLFVNEYEALELLRLAGIPPKPDMKDNLLELQHEYGCDQIVITMGCHGYICIDGNRFFAQDGLHIKPVDTSGAGDGFMGAVLSELIRGQSLEEACRFANVYAAFAVQKQGTVPGYLTRESLSKLAKSLI